MNKLDALIDACRELEETGRLRSWSDAEAFRRILEAVREDMDALETECRAGCDAERKAGPLCDGCHLRRMHAATRAALDALK